MPYLTGLALGMAMILPIGPQNLFVLNSALLGGWRRGSIAALTAAVCDTLLIALGATSVAAIFARYPLLRLALLALGIIFLLILGIGSLRPTSEEAVSKVSEMPARQPSAPQAPSLPRLVLMGIGFSWGNPHAILDTVAVLGAAIAAQAATARLPFAAGAVTASWLFFLLLLVIGAAFSARLSHRAATWIRRGSGSLMLIFALILGVEAIRLIG